jgi:multiple sugar transport system substrate-binding protein
MKRLYLVLIVLTTIVLMTACRKEEDRDYVNFYVWGDSVEVAAYERIARNFTNETGITVEVIPSTGDYYENLNIYLGSTRNAPDLFFTEQGEVLSQLATDRILNLSPYIDDGTIDIRSAANPDGKIELWDINDAYRYDGTSFGSGDMYALIKDWSPDFMMWYNKNHIDEYNQTNGFSEEDNDFMHDPDPDIPLTWDMFMDMSRKLIIKDGNEIVRYGTMIDRVPWKHLFQWIQQGGSTAFVDGKYFNADDPAVHDAFRYFSELQAGTNRSAPIIGPTGIGSGEAFANGNLSFAWFGSWAYSAFNFGNASFEIGIAPPPVPDPGRPLLESDNYGVSSGMIALAVNKETPVKDEALTFLNYYLAEGSKYMAQQGFNIPGNKKIAESDDYLVSNDPFLAHMNAYFLDFAKNYTHPVAYNEYISQIVIETKIANNFSTWINNYQPDTLDTLLENIEADIRNEIG